MGAHVHGLKKPSHHSITKDKFWCRHVQTVYTIRQHTTPLCYTAHCHIVFSAAQECACAAWGKRFVKSEHGRFCFAVCNGLDKKSTLSAGHIDLLHSSKSLSWRCSWCQRIYFQAVSSVSAWLLQPGLPWFVLASKELHLLQLDRNSQVRSKFSNTKAPGSPGLQPSHPWFCEAIWFCCTWCFEVCLTSSSNCWAFSGQNMHWPPLR